MFNLKFKVEIYVMIIENKENNWNHLFQIKVRRQILRYLFIRDLEI